MSVQTFGPDQCGWECPCVSILPVSHVVEICIDCLPGRLFCHCEVEPGNDTLATKISNELGGFDGRWWCPIHHAVHSTVENAGARLPSRHRLSHGSVFSRIRKSLQLDWVKHHP